MAVQVSVRFVGLVGLSVVRLVHSTVDRLLSSSSSVLVAVAVTVPATVNFARPPHFRLIDFLMFRITQDVGQVLMPRKMKATLSTRAIGWDKKEHVRYTGAAIAKNQN